MSGSFVCDINNTKGCFDNVESKNEMVDFTHKIVVLLVVLQITMLETYLMCVRPFPK